MEKVVSPATYHSASQARNLINGSSGGAGNKDNPGFSLTKQGGQADALQNWMMSRCNPVNLFKEEFP